MEQPQNMMGDLMAQAMQRPQSGNMQQQLHARIVSDLRQSSAGFNGSWQATHDPRDRAQRIMQLLTQLRSLNDDISTCLNIAQKWELRTFQESQSKDEYVQRMNMKLKEIHGRRQQQNLPLGAQNPALMQPGPMGNGNMMRPAGMMGALPNMPNAMSNVGNVGMNFQNGGMAMPPNQMGAGNPIFPAHLQRPMQASPVNLQAPQGTLDPSALMQQPQQSNSQQSPPPMGQQNQQQPTTLGHPKPGMNLTMQHQQQIHALAKQMSDRIPEEQKNLMRQKFLSQMNPQQRQHLQQQLGNTDPLMRFFLNKAKEQVTRQAMAKIDMSMGSNMMQMGNNMPPRPQSQTNGQGIDFSAILGQQANAVKSADAGEQVVPASNNNNNNINASMGTANQMNMPQSINPQLLANQGGQANNAFDPQHLLSQPGAQDRERLQKQHMAQMDAMRRRQATLQGQPGGLHTPNSFNNGPGGQANSPAMSMLNRPMVPPGQTTPGTPQPNRQQQTPQTPMTNANQQLMQHHQNMLNQNNQQNQQHQMGPGQNGINHQQLQQLLARVPPQFREKLQQMPPQQMAMMLQRFKQQSGDRPPGQAFQPGPPGSQAMPNMMAQQNQMPQQMGNAMPNFNVPPQANANQPNHSVATDPQALARQQQQQQMLRMRFQLADSKPFPKQYQVNLGVNLPANINTWLQLKQFIHQNTGSVPPSTLQKVVVMQKQWIEENKQAINAELHKIIQQRGGIQQQQAQQQSGAPQPSSMSMPTQRAPAAQMVPQAPMVPPAQAGNAMLQRQAPSAEDIAMFRQRFPQTAGMSDEDIRRMLYKRRMEQMRAQQAQALVQQSQQQPSGQTPQMQRPNQTPQMPNGTQAAQRTPQQATVQPSQPGSQKPNQQSNDDVFEIPSMNSQPPQAVPMQATLSQQRPLPNLSPEQLATLPEPQRRAYQSRLQAESIRKAQGQLVTPTMPNTQNGQAVQQMQAGAQKQQEIAQKITAMMAEVQKANPKGPAIPYDPADVEAARQSLTRLYKPLEAMSKTYLFAMTVGLEQRLREVMRAKVIVNQNASDDQGTMKGYYSVSLEQLKEIERNVSAYMSELKSKQMAAKSAGVGAMKPQGHNRKASASLKAPPAPTENKTFDWAHPSPQGVPKYGQNQLTPDKLKFPPQKKRKTGQPDNHDSAPATHAATSTAAGASPALVNGKIQSPEEVKKAQQIKLDAGRDAQAKKFRCKDASCEASLKGFDTEEQLTRHVQAQHQPIENPLDFLVSNAAASLGVDLDGTPLPKSEPAFTRPLPASQRPRATVKDLNPGDLTKMEADQVAKGMVSNAVKDKIAKKQAEMDAAARADAESAKEQTMLEAMAQKLDIPLPGGEPTVSGADVDRECVDWGPIDVGMDATGLPGDGSADLTEEDRQIADFALGPWVLVDPDSQDLVFKRMRDPPDSDTSPELTPSEGSQSSRASDVSQNDSMRFMIMIKNEAADLWGTGEPGLVAQNMIPMYERIQNMLKDGEDAAMGGVEPDKEDGSPKKRKADDAWDLPLSDFMDDFWNGS